MLTLLSSRKIRFHFLSILLQKMKETRCLSPQLNRNMTFSSLVLFALLLRCGHSMMTPADMKQQIADTILPPYITACMTLNDGVVQRLLNADPTSDPNTVQNLVDSLLCAARKVHGDLHNAAKAGETLRPTVHEQVMEMTRSVTNQEQHTHQSQIKHDQARSKLASAQEQLGIAESAVQDSENALNAANNAVSDAQRAVDDAGVCGLGRRRRKRFFGGFFRELNPVRIFRNVIGRPACSILNEGGIKNAKDRRGMAEHNLHEARQRLENR